MAVPILKLGGLLIVPLTADMTDAEWLALQDDLLRAARRHRSRGVILDVSTVEIMDSYAGQSITEITRMLRLRGVQGMVVGIRPEVAFSMVQLGLHLEEVPTALDLDGGVEWMNGR